MTETDDAAAARPARRLAFQPPGLHDDGPCASVVPVLVLEGVEARELAGLVIWLDGVDVTARLAAGASLGVAGAVRLKLPELRLGPGLHHLRASLPDPDGRGLSLADASFEVGEPGPPGGVHDAEGALLIPPAGGATPPGRRRPLCGGPLAAEPPTPGAACRVRHLNLDPGLHCPQTLDAAVVEALVEPGSAVVEWSDEVRVRLERVSPLFLRYTGATIEDVTRRQLAAQRGARAFETASLGPGYHRVKGPRKAEVLIAQVDRAARDLGGVAHHASIGVRCRGGRFATVVFDIHDS